MNPQNAVKAILLEHIPRFQVIQTRLFTAAKKILQSFPAWQTHRNGSDLLTKAIPSNHGSTTHHVDPHNSPEGLFNLQWSSVISCITPASHSIIPVPYRQWKHGKNKNPPVNRDETTERLACTRGNNQTTKRRGRGDRGSEQLSSWRSQEEHTATFLPRGGRLVRRTLLSDIQPHYQHGSSTSTVTRRNVLLLSDGRGACVCVSVLAVALEDWVGHP